MILFDLIGGIQYAHKICSLIRVYAKILTKYFGHLFLARQQKSFLKTQFYKNSIFS